MDTELAASEAPSKTRSLLAAAGTTVYAIAKHVPTRGVLFGLLGFVLGLVAAGLAFAIALARLERGAMLLAEPPFVLVVVLVPFASAALLGMHGLHRGAARAALELERKAGLVRHVVERVFAALEASVGPALASLPLAKLEVALKDATARYLGSDELDEGRGITRYVLRRAKRAIVRRIDVYLLAAYRAEVGAGGAGGGGVDLGKVKARVVAELSGGLGDLVMAPLQKQLFLFVALILVVGAGWFELVILLLGTLGCGRPAA